MTVDDSVLFHERPYDPAKAREYYLRTRRLRGRHGGQRDDPAARGRHPPKMTPEQRRKAVEAKVSALKNRLERLKEVLADLVKQAKERSGADSEESPKQKAERNRAAKDRKPLTEKQKRDRAILAKKNYEKEKDRPPDEQLKDLQIKVKAIRSKIKTAIKDAEAKTKRSDSNAER